MIEQSKFMRPLSLEAIAALILALVNLALDQADIHNIFVSWGSVVACIFLSSDALRRTEWAQHPRAGTARRVFGYVLITAAYFAFGWFLTTHRKQEPIARQERQEPPSPTATKTGERAKRPAARPEEGKSLRVKFSQTPPYRWESGGQTRFRFGVYNPPGRPAAENVQVSLTDIAPRPRDTQFSRDFPYIVYSANASQGMPVLINPDVEHLFEIGMVWKGGEDGKQFIVGGLGKQPGSYTSGIFMDRDEVWHLHVRVTAANARPFEIVFRMWTEDGSIRLERF